MRGVGLVVAGWTLGCGGVLADRGKLTELAAALPQVAPEARVPALVDGARAAGLFSPMCGDALRGWARAEPTEQPALAARILGDPALLCPSTCLRGSELAPLAALPPEERAAAALAVCDKRGSDPVFGGPLAPLRAAADPLEYVLVRAVAESAEAVAPGFADAHDDVLVSLAVRATPPLVPTERPQALGSFAPRVEALEALGPALRACPEPFLQHRVVVDPTGAVRAVAGLGECARGVVSGLSFPATERWEYVDVTWSVPPATDVPDVEAPAPGSE